MDMSEIASGVQHIGIPAEDMDATIEFYLGLGFRQVLLTCTPDGTPVTFLQMKNLVMEVYKSADCARKTGAIDHVAIDVTDIEEAFETVKQKNVNVLDEGIQSLPFWEKGVRFFTVEGPNKEKIEFCQRL
jgi:lactoylglutathione lyase